MPATNNHHFCDITLAQKQEISTASFEEQGTVRSNAERKREKNVQEEITKDPISLGNFAVGREKKSSKRNRRDEEGNATLTCAIDNNTMGSVQRAASTAIRRGFMVTVYLAVRSATHLSCQAGASLPTASFSPRRAR